MSTYDKNLEKFHQVSPRESDGSKYDDALDNVPKVNVIGGYNQQHPVKILLANQDDNEVAELNANTANAWYLLKTRPSIFNLVNKIIKSTALKTEEDVNTLLNGLKNKVEFEGVKQHIFPVLNIVTKYTDYETFSKNDKDGVAKLRKFFIEQAELNNQNQRSDYARLKKIVRNITTNHLSATSSSFDELEKVLHQNQLDYIEKMYGVLGIKPESAPPFNMIELIWSYWMEEGMLAQSMYAVSRRFQNISNGDRDPLANFAIDPLRSASDLLWGYIQDTPNRLTVQRRSYEYENHYGLRLYGSALPRTASADSRSKFIGAFNNLLVKCGVFYRQADNLTIKADAFPVLNALQELHLILAEGANNQYGNLPTESRIEMIVEQYILARPEIREFLNTRLMVPYKEEWMGRVDALKKLQRWDSTGVTYFYELANFGEMLLLSIRLVNWTDINSSEIAGTWAKYFRNEIQKYIFNYRAVTAVDLSSESSSTTEERNTIPGILIQRRMKRG